MRRLSSQSLVFAHHQASVSLTFIATQKPVRLDGTASLLDDDGRRLDGLDSLLQKPSERSLEEAGLVVAALEKRFGQGELGGGRLIAAGGRAGFLDGGMLRGEAETLVSSMAASLAGALLHSRGGGHLRCLSCRRPGQIRGASR